MRTKFAQTIEKIAKRDKKIIFLTGDLGFHVFESLKKILGPRFINAGVAEQNMATVAAGLAYAGLKPWIYSITPFVTVKILEQIRNDICFPKADVKTVSVGGGFDYEVAGPTHHGLDDIGLLLTLPNVKIYAPAFASDVEDIVNQMYHKKGPAYLRLTKDRCPKMGNSRYSAFRNIVKGSGITVIVLGSIIDQVNQAYQLVNKRQPVMDLWLITELPLEIPRTIIQSIEKTKKVCVIEEHVVGGGLGQYISHQIHLNNIKVNKFIHLAVKKQTSKTTGSRDYYLKLNGLDWESIVVAIKKILNI